MATPIQIGAAGGEYMEDVVVLEWTASLGETVKAGDVLVVVETAKAATEVEAPCDGVLSAIFAEPETEVPVSSILGMIGLDANDGAVISDDESVETPEVATASIENSKGNPHGKRALASPAARAEATASGVDLSLLVPSSPTGRIKKRDVLEAVETSRLSHGINATPLAKRVAEQAGIPLSDVAGTGPKGRVQKADIEACNQEVSAAQPGTRSGIDPAVIARSLGLEHEVAPASRIRQTIARRLTESKTTIPHYYLETDCNIDSLLALRAQINSARNETDKKISVNDLIIAAAAKATQSVPKTNAAWAGDQIVYYQHAHISVAVATEGGLLTPVIRSADTKTIGEISAEMSDLTERARTGKLKPAEYQGGSLSVSNLGMYGVKAFNAVINPPEGMILAIGAGEKRPVILPDGSVGAATILTVVLSCDHRLIDGALGAQWLSAFKKLVETPMSLLI